MQRPRVPTRWMAILTPTLRSARGVVLLSYCYYVSIALLSFATALFVRGMQEYRNAERSVELQQAFWASEAGLDHALDDVLAHPPTQLDPPPGTLTLDAERCDAVKTVTLANGLSSDYQVCLTALPARYRITSEGLRGGVQQSLGIVVSVVDREHPQIVFTHALSASESIVIHSGSIEGSIAVKATDQGAIQVLENTELKGDIFVALGTETVQGFNATLPNPDDLNPNTGTISGSEWLNAQGTSDPRPEIRRLTETEREELAPIVVPETMTVPTILNAGQIQSLTSQLKCLSAGTYYIKDLVLDQASQELCTTGQVDLYVEGTLTVQNGASLYGQPSSVIIAGVSYTLSTPQRAYSPKNLRLFVFPTSGETTGNVGLIGSGVTAATMYAPLMELTIKEGHQFKGAAMSRKVVMDRAQVAAAAAGAGGYATYDAALANEPIRYSPDLTRMAIRLWNRSGSAAGGGGGGSWRKQTYNTTFGGGWGSGAPSCFIATAAYGTPMAPEIQSLRAFRDQVLLRDALGQRFVQAYYRLSPPVARVIAQRPLLRALVRLALKPVVWWARRQLNAARAPHHSPRASVGSVPS